MGLLLMRESRGRAIPQGTTGPPSREPCMHGCAPAALPFAWRLLSSGLGTASAPPTFLFRVFAGSARSRPPKQHGVPRWSHTLLSRVDPAEAVCIHHCSQTLRPREPCRLSPGERIPHAPQKGVGQKRWRGQQRCHTARSAGPVFPPSFGFRPPGGQGDWNGTRGGFTRHAISEA